MLLKTLLHASFILVQGCFVIDLHLPDLLSGMAVG